MIAIAFIMIPCSIFGINSFIVSIFYWQYLRLVYIINTDIKSSFANLGTYVNKFRNYSYTPWVISWVVGKIQELMAYMVRTEAGADGGAGGANCIIF